MSADAWSALGTFVAAVVALAIAVAPVVSKRLRRPRLEFEVGRVEPCATFVGADPLSRDGIKLRMRVRNSGHSTARAVRSSVIAWWIAEKTGEWDWAKVRVDPAPFAWSRLQKTLGPYDRLDIDPGGWDLIDLVLLDLRSGRHMLLGGDHPAAGAVESHELWDVEHRLHVMVSFEDGWSLERVVRYGFSRRQFVDYFEFTDAPNANEVAPSGLLSLFDAATTDAEGEASASG